MKKIILAISLLLSGIQPCLAVTELPVAHQTSFVTSIEQRVVKFVQQTVNNLNFSAYQMGGARFDLAHGVYILDCSTYIDHILKAVYPRAYSSLVNSTGAGKPSSQHYYDFFSKLPTTSKYWDKVEKVKQLRPGDVLVFRYHDSQKAVTGGHVMMVMNKPVPHAAGYMVRVADSAAAGHSADTRLPHTSGIGIGTLMLKVNPKTGKPAAYAWKMGAAWKQNVHFAMARPLVSTDKPARLKSSKPKPKPKLKAKSKAKPVKRPK